jgi:hypothetical protein
MSFSLQVLFHYGITQNPLFNPGFFCLFASTNCVKIKEVALLPWQSRQPPVIGGPHAAPTGAVHRAPHSLSLSHSPHSTAAAAAHSGRPAAAAACRMAHAPGGAWAWPGPYAGTAWLPPPAAAAALAHDDSARLLTEEVLLPCAFVQRMRERERET